MIPLEFAYLFWNILLLIPWLILFILRKDLQKEMLTMGLLMAVFSIITAHFFWTKDWWRPVTITGGPIGFEDFILGFLTGGIGGVLYEEIFKRRLYKRSLGTHNFWAFYFIFQTLLILFVFSWIFHFTSFVASSIAIPAGVLILWFLRKDIIMSSLLNGCLMVLVMIPTYWIVIYANPDWIDKTWLFNFLSNTRLLNIPIEELVFWFIFGAGVAPFYEYWQGLRLRKM